jgi:hypothetical protein
MFHIYCPEKVQVTLIITTKLLLIQSIIQVTLIITTKLLLIQSDLVSLSLTIALPKALGSASARGEFSPSTRASPPLVSIANHAGVGSLQGEA